MARVKIISFDMDGTLIKPDFADAVWLHGLPKLYSLQYNIPYFQARKLFISEYDKISKNRIEWYDINYWLKKYKLKENVENLFDKYEDKLEIYEEVEDVLKNLKNKYKLIVLSNAPRVFLNFNLKKINHYFFRIFSSLSDYCLLKKDTNFYLKILEGLYISPNELAHVGDDYESDYLVPKNLGINAYYLDRNRKKKGNYIVFNLKDFEDKILNLY